MRSPISLFPSDTTVPRTPSSQLTTLYFGSTSRVHGPSQYLPWDGNWVWTWQFIGETPLPLPVMIKREGEWHIRAVMTRVVSFFYFLFIFPTSILSYFCSCCHKEFYTRYFIDNVSGLLKLLRLKILSLVLNNKSWSPNHLILNFWTYILLDFYSFTLLGTRYRLLLDESLERRKRFNIKYYWIPWCVYRVYF